VRLLQWFPDARRCRWAAIGSTTAQALVDQGLEAAIICPAPDLEVVAHTLTAALAARADA
jgi:uroporphyrinogen-III synthase